MARVAERQHARGGSDLPEVPTSGSASAGSGVQKSGGLAPLPVAVLCMVVAAKLVVHLATNAQYGYHRDELYYLASGRHPAFGYVDYPPITPLLARLDSTLLGDSPFALRLLPTLVGAVLVLLTTLTARELGGSRRAQALAGFAGLTCVHLLGSNWLFMTVTFDLLWWMAALLLFARLLRTRDPRLWLWIGLLLGVGLETKLTIAALGIGLAVALILTNIRWQLGTCWPWLGCSIALVLIAPNLIWQQVNRWPTLDFLRAHGEVIAAAGSGSQLLNFDSGGMLAFVTLLPLVIGPLTLPLWAIGWYSLLRRPTYRPLGVAALVAFVLFLFVGKAYYPGPLIPVLFAAGCVQLDEVASTQPRWRSLVTIAGAVMLFQAVVSLPLSLPVVPQSALARFGLDEYRKDYADVVGWPELTQQVANVYQGLSPAERQHTVIWVGNYGEAGAIDLYGPKLGLPSALSPALTYWYWKPAHVDAATAITVSVHQAYAQTLFREVQVVDHVAQIDGVRNEEVGQPILLCRDPLIPLDEVWPRLRSLN